MRRRSERNILVREPRLTGERMRRKIRGLAWVYSHVTAHQPEVSHGNTRAIDFLYRYIEGRAVAAEISKPGSTEQAEALVSILLAVKETPLLLFSTELYEGDGHFPIRAAARFTNHWTEWHTRSSADIALMGMANTLCGGDMDRLRAEMLANPLIQRGLALWQEPRQSLSWRGPMLVTTTFLCNQGGSAIEEYD